MIPQGGCWVNLPENVQKEYLGKSYFSGGGKRGILYRLSMDLPSLTLLCTPSQKQTERCHPLEERPLNIIEYAKIQTFDSEYLFHGNTTSKYKQIGNAVPVKLAKHIGREILQYFTEHIKPNIEEIASENNTTASNASENNTTASENIEEEKIELSTTPSINLQEYFDKISPLITAVLNRKSKTKDKILFDILDSELELEEMKIALKIKQKQMKYGEIWQIIIGNYKTMENLGVGHSTGLDVIDRAKKEIFEIKNRYNTDNSSSKKTNFDKLVKFKQENPEYDIIYAVINELNTGIQKNIEHNGHIIKYLSGDKLFNHVFGNNSQEIITYVKELIASNN